MLSNRLIAIMVSPDARTVELTRPSSPGAIPPPPPLQNADGSWIEKSAFYAGDGVPVDYENVIWTDTARTAFALGNFAGDTQQYATVENVESSRIVASAETFDATGRSLAQIAERRVAGASVISDLQTGKYDTGSGLGTLVDECVQVQRDLLSIRSAIDSTRVPNQRLTSAIERTQLNIQQIEGLIAQVRSSITLRLLALCTIPFGTIQSDIHTHIERLTVYMSDAFRVEQDAGMLKRLFSCQAVPFTSPIVPKIQDRIASYRRLTTAEHAENEARWQATRRAWTDLSQYFQTQQGQWKSAEVQAQLTQITTAQLAQIEQRNQSNVRAMDQLRVEMAGLSAKVAYYESTYAAAVSNVRVITVYLQLYDACQRVLHAKAAYDAFSGSLRLLEWRRAYQQLKLEEAEWRSSKSNWNGALTRLVFHVVTVYDAYDVLREYKGAVDELLGRIGAAETPVREFNERVRVFMEGKPAKLSALAELGVYVELYTAEMRGLSDLLSAHAHELAHVQSVHDYTEQMPKPASFAWVRATDLQAVDFSSDLPRHLQRHVVQVWTSKKLYDAGRITEVDIISSCVANFARIESVSWGDLAYICRQNHEILRTVERSSFRTDLMVAIAPFVETVRGRTVTLRALLNGRVRQHANKARSFLYDTPPSTSGVVAPQSIDPIRSLCEHAMRLVRICGFVHVLDTYFPSVRIPLPDAMSVLASYHDAVANASASYQRGWDAWFVATTNQLTVWRDQYAHLQFRKSTLQNQHAQSMQQFYMTKTLLDDKKRQLKHKIHLLGQLQHRIDEAELIQHEIDDTTATATATHPIVDASGWTGGDGGSGCETLYKQKAEIQLQCSVLTAEIEELEQTLQSSHQANGDDEDDELHRAIAQCSDVSLRLHSMQQQVSDETARQKRASVLTRETIRRLRAELARPDHLCRPMVCGTLRVSVQNPLFNRHRTLCKVHVALCQVRYLRHVSLSVNGIQWVDARNTFWENSQHIPRTQRQPKCTKAQLTASATAFEHVAVLSFYLPVAADRPLSTIRSLVLDVHVSLCFHDVVSRRVQTITSRHVASTGVCIKPSIGHAQASIVKPASALLVVMMALHYATRGR